MKRMIMGLGALLVGQLALTVGLAMSGPTDDPATAKAALASFEPKAIDRIVLEAGDTDDGGEIELARQEDGWTLPTLADFPADGDKVSKLLQTLSTLRRGWPVAQTDEATERFKVAEDSFERRVVLSDGDRTVATLYFGESPGYRKIHARNASGSKVYDVDFALYDAPAKAKDWISLDALDIADDQASRVAVDGLTFTRDEKGFTLEGLGADEALDPDAVGELTGEALRPDYDSVELAAKDAAAFDKPDLVVTITPTTGDPITRRYKGDPKDEKSYRFTSSDEPGRLFHVSKARIKTLLEADRSKLIADRTTPEEKPAAKDDSHSG